MDSRHFAVSSILILAVCTIIQGRSKEEDNDQNLKPTSPFSSALVTLQKQIGYNFQSIGLLRRAMTHPSFSGENNKALSILGGHVIETSVSMLSLTKDIETSAKELNHRIADITKVESSCALDGMQLGLHKVVRASPKTNSSSPALVCGAFRAIFGAIAVDTGKSDYAGNVFWKVHGGGLGRAVAL